MRIIINTSTLKVGGGVQVAVSLIDELRKFGKSEYLVILSSQVDSQIDRSAFPPNFRFYALASPAPLKTRRRVVRVLNGLEREFKPDVVLTVFGPSYWRPKAPHICGFALPWLIFPESPIHRLIGPMNWMKNWLIRKYKWRHFLAEVDFLWCETEDVKCRLGRIHAFPLDRIFVVGNTYGSHFEELLRSAVEVAPPDDGVFKLVTVSAYYRHKNFEIIRDVIPLLEGKLKFSFTLTISKKKYEEIFSAHERTFVTTVGAVAASECPKLYCGADAVFLPTLLECFSANYPEALVMRRPILTSHYSFATMLLGDAAIYFDPLKPQEIANSILQLAADKKLYANLLAFGDKLLPSFPGPGARAALLVAICEQVVKN